MSRAHSVLRHLAPVLLFSLALVLSGAPFEAPGTAGLGLLCQPENANGCQLTDFVCNGYSCCCVYSCSGGGTDVGPCQSNGFPGFPVTPSWAN